MRRLALCVLVSLLLVMVGPATGGLIIWVTDNTDAGSPPSPDDIGWANLLTAEGHTVDRRTGGDWRSLDASEIADLEAADLIIVSRDTDSGQYDDGSEPTDWNSISTPLMMTSQYLVRRNRWKWLDTTGTPGTGDGVIQVVDASHPIFAGTGLSDGEQFALATSTTPAAGTGDVGNGQLLATDPPGGNVTIAFWDTDTEFYSGSGEKAGGPRMFFGAGYNDNDPKAAYNLTPAGEAIFLNALGLLMAKPPPELTWDGTSGNFWSSDIHWDGPPPPDPQVPDATTLAIINSGEPHVAVTDATTKTLQFNGGELVLDPGSQLTIVESLEGAAGTTLTMGAGSTLVVGDTSTIATLRTSGDATVGGAGDLTVSGATFDGQNATGTFTKTGSSTLTLDNASGSGVVGTANTTFNVEDGTLMADGAAPLGASTKLTLSGGTASFGDAVSLPAGPGGLIGKWTFDNVTGTTVHSEAGGLDGEMIGSAALAPGLEGNALSLDGTNGAVDLGNPGGLDFYGSDFTISAFVNTTTGVDPNNSEGSAIFAKGGNWTSGSHPAIRYFLNIGEGVDDTLCLSTDDDSSKVNLNGSVNCADGVWHHVVAMRDGDTSRLYVDGSPDGTASLPGGYTLDTWEFNAYIGAVDDARQTPPYPARFFTGLIDDVSVYGRALTPTEVLALQPIVTPPDMSDTEVLVTTPAAGPSTLDSRSRTTLAFKSLTLEDGVTLITTGGDMSFANSAVSGPAGRSATLDVRNGVTLAGYDDGSSLNGGTATTVVKDGGGTLSLDNSSGTGVLAGSTEFRVDDGTLLAKGENPLGDPLAGAASPEVILNGGRLTVEGAASVIADALSAERYFDNRGGGSLNFSQGGGAYSLNPAGGLIVAGPLGPDTPEETGLQTGLLAYRNNGNPQNWDALFPTGTANEFQVLWSGQFTAQVDGDHAFRTSDEDGSGGVDDDGSVYIDANGDGIFQSSEGVQTGGEGNTTQTLVAGTTYNIAIGFNDNSGGDRFAFSFMEPAGGTFTSRTRVDPSTQPGFWSTNGFGPVDMTDTDITVTDDSELEARSIQAVPFGHLTLDSGTTLTTLGSPMSFASVAITGGAGRSGTLATENNVATDTYADGGTATTVIKDGPGTLTLDTSGGGIHAAATTWEVAGGTLLGDGPDPLGSSTDLVLSGGTGSFGDILGPPVGGTTVGLVGKWTFDNVTGSTVHNEVGGGPDGQLMGDASIVPGLAGSAVSLDGDGDAVDLGNPAVLDFGTGDFTLAAFINTTAESQGQTIFAKGGNWDSGAHPGIRYYMNLGEDNPDDMLNLCTDDDSDKVNLNGSTTVVDGTWHHVLAMREGDETRLYVDGAPDGTESLPGGYNLDTWEFNAYIGAIDDARETPPHPDRFFEGLIDEVYVYSRALTTAEMADLLPVVSSPDMSSTNVLVTADSTLESRSRNQLDFADLTLNDGTELDITGGPMSFANAIVDGTAAINSGQQVTLRDYNDGGGAGRTLIKRGSGPLDLPDGGPTSAVSTAFQVEAGSLNAGGAADPLSGGDLIMAGGTVNLRGATVPGAIPPDPVAHWALDESGGTTASDSVGGHDGDLIDGPAWVPGGGRIGGALDFDGSNDYVNVPSLEGAFNGETAFTFAAWIKSDNTGQDRGFFNGMDPSSSDAWGIRYDSVGGDGGGDDVFKIGLAINGDTNNYHYESAENLQTTDWQHVVMVWESGQGLQFYVDGELDSPTANNFGTLVGALSDQNRFILGDGAKANWQGLMDEIYVFDTALTAADVAGLYTNTHGGPLNMPDTHVTVTANSTLNAVTAETASFGTLTLESGTLTLEGAREGVSFASASIAPGASSVGLNTVAATTIIGPMDGGASSATVTKTGAAQLNLDQGATMGAATLRVSEGPVGVGGDATVGSLIVNPGGTVGSGANTVTVNDAMTLGGAGGFSTIYTATSGPFGVRGAVDASQAETVVLGGTGTVLTIENTQGTLLSTDIGNPGQAGSVVESPAGTYTIEGGGGDIWGNYDQFFYVYQPVSGDTEMIARVQGPTEQNAWSKAGLMIRETLDANSRHANWVRTPNTSGDSGRRRLSLQWRENPGGGSGGSNTGQDFGEEYYWLRTVRQGDQFMGYWAEDNGDGTHGAWTLWATHTVNMSADAFVGLAVTAHNNGQLSTAWYDYVTGFSFGDFPAQLHNLVGEGTVVADKGLVLGGTLGPGDGGPGRMVIQGDLTFKPDAVFEVDIVGSVAGDDYDQVAFEGDGNGSTLDDALLDIFTPIGTFDLPDIGTILTLMDIEDPDTFADGIFSYVNPRTGLTEALPEGALLWDGNRSYDWFISYNSFGGGNDVQIRLAAIPEPATMALLGLGCLALAARRRRKR